MVGGASHPAWLWAEEKILRHKVSWNKERPPAGTETDQDGCFRKSKHPN